MLNRIDGVSMLVPTSSTTNPSVEVQDTSLNGQKIIVLHIPQATLQKDVDKTS